MKAVASTAPVAAKTRSLAVPIPPVVTARWVGGLFLCCVLLQRVAAADGISILLPVVLAWMAAVLYFRVAEIDPPRLVLWLTLVVFTGLAMLAQTAWVSTAFISVNSWALILVTWLPFVLRLIDRSRSTYQ